MVDAEYFRALALTHIRKNKYNEAALIIHRFQFKEGFDIKHIIDRLVDSNKIQNAKLLCEVNPDFVVYLINILSTNDNAKTAAGIISDFKLDINQFPALKERLLKSSMRYYLGRYLYKKKG